MGKEADQFWEKLDDQLLEEERALEEFKGYLDTLSIEDAETAVHGLHEYLRAVEHPPVEELVMGWERQLLEEKPFRWDVV